MNILVSKIESFKMGPKKQKSSFLKKWCQQFWVCFNNVWRPYLQIKEHKWYLQESNDVPFSSPNVNCEFPLKLFTDFDYVSVIYKSSEPK
jgi:hypothetical protein